MSYSMLPNRTRRTRMIVITEPRPTRDAVVRPRPQGPACAGVRRGVGGVVGWGVPLDVAPQTDPAVRLTSQVSCRAGTAGENATNPCRGFPQGETGAHPGSRGRWTP
jgi:hypothetical protein